MISVINQIDICVYGERNGIKKCDFDFRLLGFEMAMKCQVLIMRKYKLGEKLRLEHRFGIYLAWR